VSNPLTEQRMESWRRLAMIAWALVGVLLLVSGGLWVLGRIASALVPFVISLVVVLLLRKPVKVLEARGVSRALAVVICYVIALAILVVFAIFVVPPIIEQFAEFAQDFPRYYDAALRLWERIQTEYLAIELPEWIDEAAQNARSSIIGWIAVTSRNLAQLAIGVGGQILGFLLNLFLAFALAFFVLRDLPTLKAEVLSLPGPARQEESLKLAAEVTQVLEGFIRGQGLIALIIGVLTAAGLAVLGVPYALLIGIIAGVTNLIPYLGPVVGGIIAAISAAFVSPQLVLWTVLWIVIIQQAESTFLQPRIMSDQVHLHPVLVILSLLIGATLGGLVGMLLAVPVAAVAKVVFVHYYEKWTDSSISAENGALFRKPRKLAADAPEAACRGDRDDAPFDSDDDGSSRDESP
jgi:predicted PurR-regulated permease PerM